MIREKKKEVKVEDVRWETGKKKGIKMKEIETIVRFG